MESRKPKEQKKVPEQIKSDANISVNHPAPAKFIDNRSEVVTQRRLQEMANVYTTKQYLPLQLMINESTEEAVTQLMPKGKGGGKKGGGKKGGGKKSGGKGKGGKGKGTSGAEPSGDGYPHEGKHRPPPFAAGNLSAIINITSDKGQASLYLTSNAGQALAIEALARQNGIFNLIAGGYIHRFNKVIGADQGEATQCIRIDGEHGHPIVEDGSKTSFDSYIKREIARLKKLNNTDALKALLIYLQGINYEHPFTKFFPKDKDPDSDDGSSGSSGVGGGMGSASGSVVTVK